MDKRGGGEVILGIKEMILSLVLFLSLEGKLLRGASISLGVTGG